MSQWREKLSAGMIVMHLSPWRCVIGFRTRITAGVLFVFALATAAFFHNHFGDQNQFIHFFKNIAIAGGLLHVIAFGGGRVSLDGRRS